MSWEPQCTPWPSEPGEGRGSQLSGSWTEQQCSSACCSPGDPHSPPSSGLPNTARESLSIVISHTAGAAGPGDFQAFSLEAEATEPKVHPADFCPLLALGPGHA